MAGVLAAAVTAEISTGTAAKTLVQVVAPAAQRLKLRKWGVTFDGVASDAAPIEVRLLRQSTAGTMSALSPVAVSPAGATVRATAQHTATAEPTAGDVLAAVEVHPQSGYVEVMPPDLSVEVAESGRVAIEVTAAAAVNARAFLWWEE